MKTTIISSIVTIGILTGGLVWSIHDRIEQERILAPIENAAMLSARVTKVHDQIQGNALATPAHPTTAAYRQRYMNMARDLDIEAPAPATTWQAAASEDWPAIGKAYIAHLDAYQIRDRCDLVIPNPRELGESAVKAIRRLCGNIAGIGFPLEMQADRTQISRGAEYKEGS